MFYVSPCEAVIIQESDILKQLSTDILLLMINRYSSEIQRDKYDV